MKQILNSRYISLFFISLIFRFSLYAVGFALAVFLLIRSPDMIKQAILEADAYNRFIPSVIEENKKDNSLGTVPFSEPQVQQIFLTAFEPRIIQTGTEEFIDATFLWLKGEKENIDFQVDLTNSKQQLANNLSTYAISRASSLPECRPKEQPQDVFRLACKPADFDLLEERRQLSKTLFEDQNFLKNPVINESTVLDDGQKLSEKYKKYQSYYRWAINAPYILGIIVIVCALIIIVFNKSFYLGIRQVGFTFFTTGIILAITPIFSTYILPKFRSQLQQNLISGSTESIVNDVNIRLYSELNTVLINVSIFVILAGILILIMSKYVKEKISYGTVESGAGLATSILRKPSQSNKLTQKTLPLQSSDQTDQLKSKPKSKKYRNIRRNIDL